MADLDEAGIGLIEDTSSVIGAEEITWRAVMLSRPPAPLATSMVHRPDMASNFIDARVRSISTSPPAATTLSRAVSHIMPGPWRG